MRKQASTHKGCVLIVCYSELQNQGDHKNLTAVEGWVLALVVGARAVKLDLVLFCVQVENDLVSVGGSTFTCSLCSSRKLLGFGVRV